MLGFRVEVKNKMNNSDGLGERVQLLCQGIVILSRDTDK